MEEQIHNEPVLNHRFYVESDYEFITKNNITHIDLPKFKINNFSKVIENQELRMYLYETVDFPVSKKILDWCETDTIRPNILVTTLDASQNELYTWELTKCKIKSVDFGTLSYEDGGLQRIKIVFIPTEQILHI